MVYQSCRSFLLHLPLPLPLIPLQPQVDYFLFGQMFILNIRFNQVRA
jgi:hypothetical protein